MARPAPRFGPLEIASIVNGQMAEESPLWEQPSELSLGLAKGQSDDRGDGWTLWKAICERRAREDAQFSGEQPTSPPVGVQQPATDFDALPQLEDQAACQEAAKCLPCNSRGRVHLCAEKDPRKAYSELLKGVLGTGESVYSQILTQYFKECLEIFCEHEDVNDYAHKFDFYLNRIRRAALVPRYGALKVALSKLVQESEGAGDLKAAIRFQKELTFFALLSGTESESPGGRRSDCRISRDQLVSMCVQELERLVRSESAGNDK
jgi:hypothetical protein